jgi:hypothetical protein
MRNKRNKITINIPEGHNVIEEKIENGVIITFVEKAIDEQKAIFFKEHIEYCAIVFLPHEPNATMFVKDGQILFSLKEINGETCFQINDLYWLEKFKNKYNVTLADTLLFIKSQVELIFKISNVVVVLFNNNNKNIGYSGF